MVRDGGGHYAIRGKRLRRLTAPECSLLLLQESFRAAMRGEEAPCLKRTGRWHILKNEARWGEARFAGCPMAIQQADESKGERGLALLLPCPEGVTGSLAA